MKRALILISILISISVISAIDLEMNSEFSQGETFYAILEGDIQNKLTSENVLFYREHVRVPVDVSFFNKENSHYILGQLVGKEPGNYSIELKDLQYIELKELKETTLVRNFTISDTIADFMVNNPAISAGGDFELELENPTSSTVSVVVDSLFLSPEIVEISSGNKVKIDFDTSTINESGFYYINLKSDNNEYNVPVYLIKTFETEIAELDVEPEELIVNMFINASYDYPKILRLKNKGNVVLENITINFSESLKNYGYFSYSYFDELEENTTLSFRAFFRPNIVPEIVQGKIKVKVDSHNLTKEISVTLNISESYIPPENYSENDSVINGSNEERHCSDLDGSICSSVECKGYISEVSLEENCCIGTCDKTEEPNKYTKLIGWALIIGLVAFGLWFYFKKYKGAKPSINLLQKAKPRP